MGKTSVVGIIVGSNRIENHVEILINRIRSTSDYSNTTKCLCDLDELPNRIDEFVVGNRCCASGTIDDDGVFRVSKFVILKTGKDATLLQKRKSNLDATEGLNSRFATLVVS